MISFREHVVKRFTRSSGWRKIRNAHIKKHPQCACCGSKNAPEVHHIQDFSTAPELELDPNNLITLCGKRCHLLFGHLGYWKSINPEIINDSKWIRNKIENRR